MDPTLPIKISESAGVSYDGSSAPSTPEDRNNAIFSPNLRPRRIADNINHDISPIRNICCVGGGYVGGPTAAVIAFQNPHIRVTVVDKDVTRIRRWNSRHPPIYEPGLEDIVRVARDGARETTFSSQPIAKSAESLDGDLLFDGSASSSECNGEEHRREPMTMPARTPNLVFSSEVSKCISEADAVLIAVNTPTKTRGAGKGSATDMTAFMAVTGEVAQHARDGAIIVEKSTVPVRTAKHIQDVLASHRPNVHFEIISNPEFLAAGSAMKDLLCPDRVLIGSFTTPTGRRAAQALADLYAAWVPRSRIMTTNIWSSELTKLAANSMLAQRISSINSIAPICEKTGGDINEVARAIGGDTRVGAQFLKAGIGFGGSCFKKDLLSLVYLAESLGLGETAEYWQQVLKMNEYSRDRFARRVVLCLDHTLVGKKVTILGYAFKKNTNDTRETPALEIIRTLLEEAPKELAVFDPCCNPAVIREEIRMALEGMGIDGRKMLKEDGGPLAVYYDAYAACDAADGILITTEFDEFKYKQQQDVVHASADVALEMLHITAATGVSLPAASGPSSSTAGASNTAMQTPAIDPRPFEHAEPAESDVLDLHKFLVKTGAAAATGKSEDPLERYNPEPACDESCPDCLNEKSGYRPNEEYRPKERLDWPKIAYHMKLPKWVFDGRGILDSHEMEKLGIRLESVGRQGRLQSWTLYH